MRGSRRTRSRRIKQSFVIANVVDSAESLEANSWTLCKPNGAKSFFNGGTNSVSRLPVPIADKLNRHVGSRSLAEPGPMSNSRSPDIRENWEEFANGQNGRGRISRALNWRPVQAAKQG
jgi:hypothetical protein